MSGIFGVFDPAGADATRLQHAARVAAYRGTPNVQTEGPVAMGVFAREGEPLGLLASGGALIAADARVDGTVLGSAAAALAESGLALLESVVRTLGPEGLGGVAADFALARYEPRSGELLLARDAVGMRPLYWARVGERAAFACDPAILIELGFASGELDREAITVMLFVGDTVEDYTGFVGVHRLVGGRWVRFRMDGRGALGRWFRPERVPERPMSLDEAADRTREAVLEATRCRAEGHRVAHQLSAGRDSGTVAVAMGELGIRATCLTYRWDADDVIREGPAARELALAVGHEWRDVPVSRRVEPSDLAELPQVSGTPLGFPLVPTMFALRDAVAACRASMLFDGQGGEPLFTATPVAVLDLLKQGRPYVALRAARGFSESWLDPYVITLKQVARALAPTSLIRLRERARPAPPWLLAVPHRHQRRAYRSARDYVVRSLVETNTSAEYMERMMQMVGAGYACPLLDMRVIRCAMETPLEWQVPAVEPKPVLARAFLRDWAATRMKAPFTGYFVALAEALQADFPSWFEPGSLAAREGYVRGEGLVAAGRSAWLLQSLGLVPVEAWLRRRDGRA